MSQRNVVVDEDDRLLDAARACVLAVGVRRTTVTDVARRAGVSRMTLYRRFPDLEGILAALMTREFGRLVAAAAEQAAGATTRERVVAMVTHGSRALAEDPLFVRLLDVDPELLLPYVTHDGSVRADAPPEVLAAALELIARGFVLASHGELGLDPWAELARAIDGYLRP
jgi:AcrR family transcriptional regulator